MTIDPNKKANSAILSILMAAAERKQREKERQEAIALQKNAAKSQQMTGLMAIPATVGSAYVATQLPSWLGSGTAAANAAHAASTATGAGSAASALGGGSAIGGGAGGGAAAAGAGAAGEGAAAGAAGETAAAGSGLSMLGPIAAMAYTGYQGVKALGRVKQGKGLTGQQRGLLALPTFGGSEVYHQLHGMWDKNKWQTEGKRLRAVGAPQSVIDSMPTKGRSKEELVELARQNDGNPEFAESRDEGQLRAKDTMHYAVHSENLGKAYYDASDEQRTAYNQALLDNKLIREHHGTVDYTDAARAKQLWDEILGGKSAGASQKTADDMAATLSTGKPKKVYGISR